MREKVQKYKGGINKMAKILTNEPIGEDLFESKSQEHIASSIIEQIDQLKLIGIEGGWGTGKSNLVKIIERKLNDNKDGKKYSFFIYDAWGHQEDVHRRSLIEELVDYVKTNKLVDGYEEIEKKKDEIVGSVVTTKVEVFSGFSWATFFLLCAVISSPITSAFQYDNPYLQWKAIPFLSLLLVLIAAIFAVYSAHNNKTTKKSFKERFKDELIGAYKRGDTNQEKTEYKNTRNPSTASVQKFFAKLNKNLSPNTFLVIVVDNLDRMEKEKVQNVWATIQTCFAGDNYFDRIKVIVPFDRYHLKGTLLENEKYVDDYLNKTFDIVFRVAPPVLSDWEDFFTEHWKKAFDGLEIANDKTEIDLVKRIYDSYTEKITPRDIIAFINECLAIYMLKIEGIKFRYIAVFVKKKDNILKDIVTALSDLSYLGSLEYLFSKDELYLQSIAALAYQVSLNKGIEVAVRRQLQQALVGNDANEVLRIAEIRTFSSLLGEILEDIQASADLFTSICVLKEVEPDKFGGEDAFFSRWKMILDKVKHISKDDVDVLQDYQKILLEKLVKKDKIDYVQYLLRDWYDRKQIDAMNLSQNLDAIDKIVSLNEVNVWDMVEEYVVDWTKFKPFVEKYHEAICKYKIKCDEKAVDEYLASLSHKDLEGINYVPILQDEKYGLKFNLVKYIQKLQDDIKVASNIQEYSVLLVRLKEALNMEDEENHIIDIGRLANFGELSNYMQMAKNDRSFERIKFDILAIALVKFDYNSLQSNPTFSEYFRDDNKEIEQVAQKVAECIEYYMDYGEILLQAESMKQSVLYQRVCQLLTEDEHQRAQYLALKKIVPKFETIVVSTGINQNDLAKHLSLWKIDNIENLDKSEVEQVITKSFLQFTKNIVDNEFIDGARKRVLQYLKGLSHDEWKKYLQQGMESYGIWGGLFLKFEWTDSAMLAVKELFEEAAKEQRILGTHKKWNELVDSLRNNNKSLKQTFGNVYDNLKGRKISADEFKFWADWIFEADVIKPDEATLRRFMPEQFLEDRDCIKIMLRHKETVKAIYLAAKEEKKDFENHLLGLLEKQQKTKEDDGNEIMNELRELAQALDISLSSIPERDSIDD